MKWTNAQKSRERAKTRALERVRAHSRASSLTSYLGNANTALCYALCVAAVLWFTGKDNRPARSLWRHYPVRLESIFSTRCGNDCAVPGPGRPAAALRRRAAAPHDAKRRDVEAHRRRLPLRHLNRIRLTADRHVSTIVLSPLARVMPRACNTRI